MGRVGGIWGITTRRAVAVALPLAGAIYLAAEDRHYVVNTADGPQVITLREPQTRDAQDDRVRPSSAARDGWDQGTTGVSATVRSATPASGVRAPAQDPEVAAEQQAAQIPAQQPMASTVAEAHTRQIVISVRDRRLALLEDGQMVKDYPVAVGKEDTPSPEGEFTIVNHAVNPTYRHDGKVIGPGKSNPLGTRWMGLSLKGYGIHGTNVQSSVGKVASHGCFRMKKKDVEELYTLVQVGDAVSIRGERDELTASLFSRDSDSVAPGSEVASAAAMSPAGSANQ
jgi:lipoprotein-anchoring transpeptidase ErfK/SrfK